MAQEKASAILLYQSMSVPLLFTFIHLYSNIYYEWITNCFRIIQSNKQGQIMRQEHSMADNKRYQTGNVVTNFVKYFSILFQNKSI